MTKADSNKQPNGSALQRKKGVLRARDIIPPFNKQAQPLSNPPVKTSDTKVGPLDSPVDNRRVGEIPELDLAEKILAEQRKTVAEKRKAPGKKGEAPSMQPRYIGAQSPHHIVEQPPQILSEQEQIIAEIVARDIQRFCRRNT